MNVNLRFNWRSASATGKAAGPALRLAPYETRRIDVAALQAANAIPKEANWASVILTTNGPRRGHCCRSSSKGRQLLVAHLPKALLQRSNVELFCETYAHCRSGRSNEEQKFTSM